MDGFTGRVLDVLKDPTNLPPEFLDYLVENQSINGLTPAAQRAPMLIPTGTPGATAASRFVGATASAAPTSGTHVVGDVVVGQAGVLWVCTTAGTPGTWQRVGSAFARGLRTSNVTSTGTTFAAGTDILAAALSFVADGTSTYVLRVQAVNWNNSAAGNNNQIRMNLDGADNGFLAVVTAPGNSYGMTLNVAGAFTPSAGSHTVNARLTVSAGTATIQAGSGGAGNFLSTIVSLEPL